MKKKNKPRKLATLKDRMANYKPFFTKGSKDIASGVILFQQYSFPT